MAKLLKKDGRMYIELPESLQGKNIKAIKLADEIFVVASDDAIKKLLERQMYYVLQKRMQRRLVQRENAGQKQGDRSTTHIREFAILSSDEQARAFSRAHAAEFKAGKLLGVKGFDGRYYVVRADVYENVLGKIEAAVRGGGATVKEIAEKTGLDANLVRAVVEIAREDGIIYEMPGGKYAYAG
ncbi:MAG: hypothetical protein GXN93_00975 [Candidatus Diapherotrites archaeon]|nr:hypothetical protein [Candidatus Diapherotrites archaeon]